VICMAQPTPFGSGSTGLGQCLLSESSPYSYLRVKILIVSFTFPPNKDGISEAASIMASGFLGKGWEVEVATSPVEPPRSEMAWRGARIHEFTFTGNGLIKYPLRGDLDNYQLFLERGDWDVVIFHAYSWSIYVPLKNLSAISGKKILVSHGYYALQWVRAKSFPWGLGVLFMSALQALQMFFWVAKIDRVVYLSNRADFKAFFDHWIAKFMRFQGRRVIPNGVDPAVRGRDAKGFRQGLGIANEQVLFLCVANYSRRKDQGYAAQAFRAANLANAVMVFIGSEFNGESARFQAEDEALPASQKTGRVIWLEKVDRNATLDALAACDVFVLSADHEAQPIVLLEAMREAKPWVARDAGCIAEMPGGISVRSKNEMARQMVRLHAEHDLRTLLGSQGRNAVERTYNYNNYVDSYCDLVSEMVLGNAAHMNCGNTQG